MFAFYLNQNGRPLPRPLPIFRDAEERNVFLAIAGAAAYCGIILWSLWRTNWDEVTLAPDYIIEVRHTGLGTVNPNLASAVLDVAA